ncbi:hypothetical protein TNCV_1021291 [Trichonephila clavipes]|uniref:HTH psq-type domain-containing protein n=1 Tax=Trichonephila clavipes TaxID=2585209 RepID=A0A8X6VNG8_TRICX|nr:hypothetical protein TNCV_1021291 [Trichonephila clavipes]
MNRGSKGRAGTDAASTVCQDPDTVLIRVESIIESTTKSNEFRSKDGTVVRIPDANFNIVLRRVTKNTAPRSTRILTTTICVNNQVLIGVDLSRERNDMSSFKKYKCLTISEKKVIESVEEGERKVDVAKSFEIPLSSLSTILKNKEKFFSASSSRTTVLCTITSHLYQMLVDTDIAVCGSLSDTEIVALDHNNTESDEDESEELTPATLSEAKVSLSKLRNFFLQNHVDAAILQASFVLEKYIDKVRLNALKQKKR